MQRGGPSPPSRRTRDRLLHGHAHHAPCSLSPSGARPAGLVAPGLGASRARSDRLRCSSGLTSEPSTTSCCGPALAEFWINRVFATLDDRERGTVSVRGARLWLPCPSDGGDEGCVAAHRKGIAELGEDVWRGDQPPAQPRFVVLGTPARHSDFVQAWTDKRFFSFPAKQAAVHKTESCGPSRWARPALSAAGGGSGQLA